MTIMQQMNLFNTSSEVAGFKLELFGSVELGNL